MTDTVQLPHEDDDVPTRLMVDEDEPVADDELQASSAAQLAAQPSIPAAAAVAAGVVAFTPKPSGVWSWVRNGLRATVGLRTAVPWGGNEDGPGAGTMVLIVAVCQLLLVGAARWEVEGNASFVLRNWLFTWASTALLLCGVWLVFQWGKRYNRIAGAVASWWLLSMVAATPMGLLALGLSAAAAWGHLPDWWLDNAVLGWGVFGFFWVWLLVATVRVTIAVNRSVWVCAAVVVCVFGVQAIGSLMLHTRFWLPDAAETSQSEPETLQLSQEVFEVQQGLLQQATQALRPAELGEGIAPQVFGLVYAPYSQDVFLRESAMVQEVLETRFAAKGRVLRMVNHPTTAQSMPWATTRNLQQGLTALAQSMDLQRDLLVVYMTSHGGADFKLAASHWPLEVPDLTAQELRTMLDDLGIRNRVIAVSACYSGGWVEPLQGDTTLVMTAADKDHTSYGCGSRSELTFFGRAVFDEQLRGKTLSFEDAFRASVPVIAQREVEGKKTDGFSNPQIAIGAGIKPVLLQLEQALRAP